jgi:tetratricopeptide (TPR) repeat protein
MSTRVREILTHCLIAAFALLAACAGGPPRGEREAEAAQDGVTEAVAQQHREAVALLEAERYDEAEPILREIVAEAPALVAPRVNLAIAFINRGRLAEAQAVLEEAVVIAPESAVAQTQLGVVCRMRGSFAEAERAYLAAIAADPAYAYAHYDLGVLYDLYLGRPGEALAHYEQYQALAGGEDEQVKKWIADLSRRYGDAKTADAVEP